MDFCSQNCESVCFDITKRLKLWTMCIVSCDRWFRPCVTNILLIKVKIHVDDLFTGVYLESKRKNKNLFLIKYKFYAKNELGSHAISLQSVRFHVFSRFHIHEHARWLWECCAAVYTIRSHPTICLLNEKRISSQYFITFVSSKVSSFYCCSRKPLQGTQICSVWIIRVPVLYSTSTPGCWLVIFSL